MQRTQGFAELWVTQGPKPCPSAHSKEAKYVTMGDKNEAEAQRLTRMIQDTIRSFNQLTLADACLRPIVFMSKDEGVQTPH